MFGFLVERAIIRKEKREKRMLQRHCPHDLFVVAEYRSDRTGNKLFDLYCPMCELLDEDNNSVYKDLKLEMNRVHKRYHSQDTDTW